MLEIDLVLFQALHADAATLPAVVTVARWVSQQLPTAMGGLLLGSLVLGNAAQRRALALALASMALAWLGVQLLRLAVPALPLDVDAAHQALCRMLEPVSHLVALTDLWRQLSVVTLLAYLQCCVHGRLQGGGLFTYIRQHSCLPLVADGRGGGVLT